MGGPLGAPNDFSNVQAMQRDGENHKKPFRQKRGGGSSRGTWGQKTRGGVGGRGDFSGRGDGLSRVDGSSTGDGGNTSQRRFEEAQARMQQAVKKHMLQEYESSDEEEDLEIQSILGTVLQSYAAVGGALPNLGRTQHFLEEVFQSGAATCLICIGSVKRVDAVWSCDTCYCFLHLSCTQRWAKDSLIHQKQALEDLPRDKRPPKIAWPCPKCRKEYEEKEIPQKYLCFCGQKQDPPHHPWLVPHSCGETCGRALQPACGHHCLLLCHPGPCPPCPKTIRVSCHCGKEDPKPQRCSNKLWSCGAPCGSVLSCGSHRCAVPCHQGECEPCPKTSEQPCACGRLQQKRPCAAPVWHCEKVCGKKLSCGHHCCERVCHSGSCGVCPLTEKRTCPCGKRPYQLPCTEEAPPCGDTCGITLNCGIHTCPERCHRDKCGLCLEMTVKQCRCGLHQKQLPCAKEYLCETKCKRSKDCGRHPCNRKCCDTQCPPCEKLCGRTLPCGQHKCESVCHRGPCYPCPLTASVRCRCGFSVINVSCGRQRRTKPPRCSKLCMIPPDCHHESRKPHYCHFGSCPPCGQVCGKVHSECEHACPQSCHSAVWVKIEQQAPVGPWELTAPQHECREMPCPPCVVPIPVKCLGGHEISNMACHQAISLSCGKQCGQPLKCGNHTCALECHPLTTDECEQCDRGCTLPRPPGCTHECTRPCHPTPCPPCGTILRPRCHCGVTQLFIKCADWTRPQADHDALTSCANPCPKSFACGHKCTTPCHPGVCPNAQKCTKKAKLYCPCRRIKKDFRCDLVRSSQVVNLQCDELCKKLKEDREKEQAEEMARRKGREEEAARLEAERFQKKLDGTGRRKNREKPTSNTIQPRKHSTLLIITVSAFVTVLSAVIYFHYS